LGPDVADVAHVVAAVLAGCDQQGLSGRALFAIDGVKLPSNASKQALIADGAMRQRDARFATQARYRAKPDPLHDKTVPADAKRSRFQPSDFTDDAATGTCVCPAGKTLRRSGTDVVTRGFLADPFRGTTRDCGSCPLRTPERTPERTPTRQVAFFRGPAPDRPESYSARMRQAIDTPAGRARYAQRFATVEPVFATLRHNKGLDRCTLRGRTKVEAQWRLFCLVHNIEKLAHHGYEGRRVA
jgi:hypothetical protein